MKELQQFNLFSISQICDKKNRVLFTDTDCLVLSKDFMLSDESMMVLRVPKKHNLYTINLNNLSPRGNLACLVAKALIDESVKWHRRMGHVNYKNMNKLVKVSACSRNQVTPTTSNLEAVKMKIFKYLKGQPRLGLWYPKESPFVLEAYSDSDYAEANKDRKSTTGGC
ncbi:putative ribonuclease H-like domain-containing protein [Tanacetum coccineum]